VSLEPEHKEFSEFFSEFNKESDRGAALNAAALIDEWLQNILTSFLVENKSAKKLVNGFNAPLGDLSSRAVAAHALGLIQDNESHEINLIRKIRNEFGHKWKDISFENHKVASLTRELPWGGPSELEEGSTNRQRFNFATSILLMDLIWRARLATQEKRVSKMWPNKSRK
jgi:DNA-binding MltR family transcriptional regulator